MMNPNDKIEAIRNMAVGYKLPYLLFAAVKLGFFKHLGNAPVSAELLAGELQISVRATAAMADGLTHFGLLSKENNTYALADYAPVLTKDSPFNQTGFLLHSADSAEAWSQLAASARGENEARTHQREGAAAAVFAQAMNNFSFPQAQFLTEKFSFADHEFLDVGAGAGTFSRAVIACNPAARGIMLELPERARVLREQLSPAEGERLTVAAQSFQEYLPRQENRFDDIFLFAVIHLYDPQTVAELLIAAWRALKPGGRLFLTSFFLEENRTEPGFSVLFNLQMLLDSAAGRAYTHTEIRRLISRAGFDSLDFLPQLPTPAALYVARKSAATSE